MKTKKPRHAGFSYEPLVALPSQSLFPYYTGRIAQSQLPQRK